MDKFFKVTIYVDTDGDYTFSKTENWQGNYLIEYFKELKNAKTFIKETFQKIIETATFPCYCHEAFREIIDRVNYTNPEYLLDEMIDFGNTHIETLIELYTPKTIILKDTKEEVFSFVENKKYQ